MEGLLYKLNKIYHDIVKSGGFGLKNAYILLKILNSQNLVYICVKGCIVHKLYIDIMQSRRGWDDQVPMFYEENQQ